MERAEEKIEVGEMSTTQIYKTRETTTITKTLGLNIETSGDSIFIFDEEHQPLDTYKRVPEDPSKRIHKTSKIEELLNNKDFYIVPQIKDKEEALYICKGKTDKDMKEIDISSITKIYKTTTGDKSIIVDDKHLIETELGKGSYISFEFERNSFKVKCKNFNELYTHEFEMDFDRTDNKTYIITQEKLTLEDVISMLGKSTMLESSLQWFSPYSESGYYEMRHGYSDIIITDKHNNSLEEENQSHR